MHEPEAFIALHQKENENQRRQHRVKSQAEGSHDAQRGFQRA